MLKETNGQNIISAVDLGLFFTLIFHSAIIPTTVGTHIGS